MALVQFGCVSFVERISVSRLVEAFCFGLLTCRRASVSSTGGPKEQVHRFISLRPRTYVCLGLHNTHTHTDTTSILALSYLLQTPPAKLSPCLPPPTWPAPHICESPPAAGSLPVTDDAPLNQPNALSLLLVTARRAH